MMPVMYRALAAGLLIGLLAPAAQAQAPAADAPKRGGTFIYSVSQGEPETFDCHATITLATLNRLAPHYSMLIQLDPKNYPEVRPDLAESWTISPDGLTYTFKLRSGVTFHDGTPLTSADIKASYDRIRSPKPGTISPRQTLYRDISAIETPDDQTVVFKLSKPNAAMMIFLASPWNCIYSAKKLASDASYPARTVMGTGPFTFVNYVAGAEWNGKRFDNYWRKGMPYLDAIKIISMSGQAWVTATMSGQVMTDFRGYSSPDRDRIVAAKPDIQSHRIPVSTTFFLYSFNTTRKPLDDVRVRQALTMAIDRKAGQEVMSRMMTISISGGFLRPGSPYALPKEELAKLPGFWPDINASRAEARRLLAEAGVKDLKLTFLNRAQYPHIGVFLIDQWRQIGVTVTQELPENARFFSQRDAGNYDIVSDGQADFADEPSFQFANALSHDISPQNASRIIDRKIDELYERQARELDPAKRKPLVNELETYLTTQAYRMPWQWGSPWVIYAKEVRGYPISPSLYVGLDLAEFWLDK